eukprot:gene14447-15992_t
MNSEAEFFDVLIIGAGISGIGCAYHLQKQLPGKTFVILEKKEHFGGTWWSHQYPGVRSDSDLYTFGFSFKPWKGVPIAAGEEIMKYLGEVISENNLQSTIRYQQEVLGCNFSTAEHRWEVNAQDVRTSTPIKYSATFLFMCPGYYNHETPFTPTWPGMSEFKGRIVHPQQWPKDLDLTEKRVVVIGSGATAATLIPAIAPTASHVTMLFEARAMPSCAIKYQSNPTHFKLHGAWCMVHGAWCMVHGAWCMVHGACFLLQRQNKVKRSS